jgi:tRNA uridine 5-carboxymethylaminomethyl modification enzyme
VRPHQLFVLNGRWNTVEIYVNGFFYFLPEEVQYEAMRKVPGFEMFGSFDPDMLLNMTFSTNAAEL